MALEAITVNPLGVDVPYRQTQMPDHVYGTFVADDTNNHQLKVAGRGKGRFTVAVDNLANQTVTVTIYGMHAIAGLTTDPGTFSVGSFTITDAENEKYETCADPFPFYLIDIAYSVAPTDVVKTTCTVYVDFEAF